MRAVTVHNSTLSVSEVPTPVPGQGQVLIKVLRSGICGSDLHVATHAQAAADVADEVGYPDFARPEDTVVLGHEFLGEVISYGPGCHGRWAKGTRVVALPLVMTGSEIQMTGLSPKAPGGYAEFVVTNEEATFEVPAGLDPDLAALTEPLAVAHRAVRRGQIRKKDPAVVIGCGPIGLAVILMLKAAGVRRVIASDFSAARRDLAAACGADVVVDPATDSPWAHLGESATMFTQTPAYFRTALETLKVLRKVPGTPWWRVMRAGMSLGAGPRGPVVFECVGVPGIIEDIVTRAPFLSRIVVVGVCMEPDTFRPTMASNKELELVFSFCYDPVEFRETLMMIAKGTVNPRPLVTGVVGLDGVAGAFADLGTAEHHAKILIDPSL